MEINKEFIIKELSHYPEYDLTNLLDINNGEIVKIFNEHCEKYSETIEIGSLYEESETCPFLTETPDGWQMVGDLIKKSSRNILKFEMVNGFIVSVSSDHLFETPKGWIKSGELKEKDLILTKEGFIEIKSILESGIEDVYDWEILHENHRYWSSGISSHNTGKSFFCLNVVREAQKIGYDVIYCDTEGAIDKSGALKFGIDAEKLRYQPIQTVSQFQTFASNVIDAVKKAKAAGQNPKVLLVLDSLGMLSTDKELADAIKGHNAADMGAKAKELRKLFRVITLDLTAAKIPLICTNHVYCLTAGHKILMYDDTYKNIEDVVVGDKVKTLAGDRNVCSTSEFEDREVIKLTLENGQTIECTPNHKFLVENEWTDEQSWKCSADLVEGDCILSTGE
jgi:intein/homing endonuclease